MPRIYVAGWLRLRDLKLKTLLDFLCSRNCRFIRLRVLFCSGNGQKAFQNEEMDHAKLMYMVCLHYGVDAAAEVEKPEVTSLTSHEKANRIFIRIDQFAINDTPVWVLLPPGSLNRQYVICIDQSDQIQVTTFSPKEPTVGLTTLRRQLLWEESRCRYQPSQMQGRHCLCCSVHS
ncbi:hypothetical protein Droror1_Dr00002967 [Drosera rotundifolia]